MFRVDCDSAKTLMRYVATGCPRLFADKQTAESYARGATQDFGVRFYVVKRTR